MSFRKTFIKHSSCSRIDKGLGFNNSTRSCEQRNWNFKTFSRSYTICLIIWNWGDECRLHCYLRKTLFLYVLKEFLVFRIVIIKVFFDPGMNSSTQLIRVVLSFLCEGVLSSLSLMLLVSLVCCSGECSITMSTCKVSQFSTVKAEFLFLSPWGERQSISIGSPILWFQFEESP